MTADANLNWREQADAPIELGSLGALAIGRQQRKTYHPTTRFTYYEDVEHHDNSPHFASARVPGSLTGVRPLLFGTYELCAEGNMDRHDLAAVMSLVLVSFGSL